MQCMSPGVRVDQCVAFQLGGERFVGQRNPVGHSRKRRSSKACAGLDASRHSSSRRSESGEILARSQESRGRAEVMLGLEEQIGMAQLGNQTRSCHSPDRRW